MFNLKPLIIFLLAMAPMSLWAQEKKETTTDRSSDKLDLKKLEDKYWSTKDTDFTVVQNRLYPKNKRAFVSGSFGALINDPYSIGRMASFSTGYYFSERWGLELVHERGASMIENPTVVAVREKQGSLDYNEFRSATSINLIAVPFYSKTSFWDSAILYFDIQFAIGLGLVNYDNIISADNGGDINNNSTPAVNFDVTQQLFVSRNLAVRFDIRNRLSKQKLYQYRTIGSPTPTPTQLQDRSNLDTSMLLGLTYFF